MSTDDTAYKIAVSPHVLHAKLQPGDDFWPILNASFECRRLSQLELANEIYAGHSFTVWHSGHWRTSTNYQTGQHLGLDMDTEDARSTMSALMREPFIAHHAAMIYTTLSHTPDKPRARVVFLLDTPIVQAKNYALAASALLWLFGTADRACRDAVRFFYGGKPGACELEWLNHELPLSLVKDLIARYQATGAQTKQHATKSYTPGNANEQEVMDALKRIPAYGISYDEWINVLMALHAEFPDSGLSMAEAWGNGKDDEIAYRWHRFKTTGNSNGRVGIGTLFAIAKRHGWHR